MQGGRSGGRILLQVSGFSRNLRTVKEKAKHLNIDIEMLRRPLNVGFSGGEKKRNEILQMSLV